MIFIFHAKLVDNLRYLHKFFDQFIGHSNMSIGIPFVNTDYGTNLFKTLTLTSAFFKLWDMSTKHVYANIFLLDCTTYTNIFVLKILHTLTIDL